MMYDHIKEIPIKDIVKGTKAHMAYYRNQIIYYRVRVEMHNIFLLFPVPLDDIGNASLMAEMSAITLMRYIRKAKEDGTLIESI